MKKSVLTCLFAFAFTVDSVLAQSTGRASVMEAYPDKIKARIEALQRLFIQQSAASRGKITLSPQFIIDTSRKWTPGQTVKVGFSGGDAALRAQVETAAQQWSRYCNINLNFRDGTNYREWSNSDSDYAADIRISFDQDGYWSAIGRDGINPSIFSPRDASMNFAGFIISLPSDYATVVKHEFGHALGFEHEHQNPLNGCDQDFRWEDDIGYVPTRDSYGQFVTDSNGKRPGIYTVLGGPPNNWPKDKVDFNLRQLRESHAYTIGPFDVKYIMKYYFLEWMFVTGTASHCYSPQNLDISAGDQQGAASVYPKTPKDIKDAVTKQRETFEAILQMKGLQPALQQKYKSLEDSLPK